MVCHRAQDFVIGRVVAEAELFVLRFGATNDFNRTDAEKFDDAPKFVDGERIVEVLANRQLDAGFVHELEGRSALAATWVVEEDVGHARRIAWVQNDVTQ